MKDVVSVQLMRESDKFTIENLTSSRELMKRAGESVYSCINWFGKIAIICGKGNNAGDGFVLADILDSKGFECMVFLLYDNFSDDGKFYFDICVKAGVPYQSYTDDIDLSEYDFIVDCIYGTGFKGVLKDEVLSVVQKINSSNAFVVSVDINSGLNGDNGLCDVCVKSDLTLSIGTIKSGHLLNMARDNIKKLVNCDIGIEIIDKTFKLIEKSDIKSLFPKRDNFSYKGTYGITGVFGGSKAYSGAVKLANMSLSSLKCGCGISRLIIPSSILDSVAPYILESTLFTIPDNNDEMCFNEKIIDDALNKVSALSIGMGWGRNQNNIKILEYILKTKAISLVIDADGLYALNFIDKDIIRNTLCKIIITPHMGEFSFLTGLSYDEIINNPIRISMDYARDNKIIVLLKGTTTIVTDGVDVYLCQEGNPGMATAGSGDVLSGVIAGVLGYNVASAFIIACCASLAGLAGNLAASKFSEISMTSSDTVRCISDVICDIIKN